MIDSPFSKTQEVYSYLEKISLDTQSFCNKTIADKAEIENLFLFARKKSWFNSACVNVFDVIGTAHPDYAGHTWKYLILNGKRMEENIRLLVENPKYYILEERKDPTMYYTQVGDKIYIGDDGNHRTVLAKILFFRNSQSQIHGINLTKYEVDLDFKERYEELCRAILDKPFQMKIISKTLQREDGAGWMQEEISLRLIVENSSNRRKVILENLEDMTVLAEEIRAKSFLRRFKNKKFRYFIY